MPATFTATGYLTTPRDLPAGVVAQTFEFTYAGSSASVSDVIYIGRLKAGIKILDGWFSGVPGTSDPSTFKAGYVGADTAISSAVTLVASATNRIIANLPVGVSLSADAEGLLYKPIIVTKVTGTSTATAVVRLTLLLQNDPV